MTAPVTPRPAATVMLLRDAPDLEVLLLRRAKTTPFAPGAHVFPGGAVDPGDDDARLAEVIDGLDHDAAAAILGADRGGMAFWVAAVRECLEEAGILLAHDDRGPVGTDHPVFQELTELRGRIETGAEHLADAYRRLGLRLPLDQLVYVSRWITPEPSPRRYDTRFFAAAMPDGQSAAADEWEAVDVSWWRPAEALESWQAGDIDLIEPTVASLSLLAELPSTTAALRALRESGT